MGLLFDRTVQVDFGRLGQEGTRVTNLFVEFDIEKTSESNPSKGTVSIFNLNETRRSQLQDENLVVRLFAGYQGIPELIFDADISKAISNRSGNDIVTKIECGDGQSQFANANINKTFDAGIDTKKVLEELASELKVGIGTIKGVIQGKFQNGITLTGSVRDRLDEVTAKMGVEWSIQDRALVVLPQDEPASVSGVLLNQDTGLIGQPAKTEEGIEFVSLLRAAIKPSVAVQIQSRVFNGFVKIRKARYVGNNRTGPFEVRCEGKIIEGAATEINQQLNLSSVGALA